jgi:large subunit ribosomal protein L29
MRELKAEKVRDMTVDEIETRIRELHEELFNLRFRNAMRQLQNPVLIRERRRDIARMRTILVEHRTGKRKLSGHGDAPQAGAAVAAREPAKAAKAVKEPKRETTERKRAPKEAKKAAKEPKK